MQCLAESLADSNVVLLPPLGEGGLLACEDQVPHQQHLQTLHLRLQAFLVVHSTPTERCL